MRRLPWRKRAASELLARASQVKFEVSRDAAALIPDRGGQLWIWPSPATRSAYATTEPPGDAHEWTTYRQAGFVAHVDAAIVPPQCWSLALPGAEARHLLARWIGADRDEASRRIQLVPEPKEPVPRRRRVMQGFVLLLVAWLLGSLALEFAGVYRWWFAPDWLDEALHLAALLVVAVAWAWQRLRPVDTSAP